MSDSPAQTGDLEMKFDMNVLEHLGLKMYTNLPAVVSEYVANSWDAWANEVEVTMPENQQMNPDYEITITDDGFGMTVDDIDEKFLVVGRNRRVDEAEGDEMVDVTTKDGEERDIMGRKGIGKLAGFGVANTINVWTCRDGEYVEFEMNFPEMKEKAPNDPNIKDTYEPDVLDSGYAEVEDTNGTIITLTDLKYEQRPSTRYVRQQLARRFGVIDRDDFDVIINGEPVTADERGLKSRCQFVRDYTDEVVHEEDGREYKIEGWIGTFKDTVPDEIGTGVVVMARGKMVQEQTHFGIAEGGTTGQAALSYLVGEIHADWIDEGDRDQVGTARDSVVWDEKPASHLKNFLQSEIRSLCREWPEMRREESMEDLKERESYEKHIEHLDPWEKDLADSFLGQLSEGDGYDDDLVDEMASYVSTGVQNKRLSHLMKEIEESDAADAETVIELFREYEVLDAMNSLQVVRSRLKAIQKFDRLVETNAREVPEMHDFIGENPWLLDPRWDYLSDEVTFRQMLVEEFPDDELENPDKRIDFVCLEDTNSLRIVEIKRPDVTIGINELEQLKRYVRFARRHHGDDEMANRDIEGYVIGKRLADSPRAKDEYRRMKDDGMYVRTYSDLQRLARQSQTEFLEAFERKAERTGSEMLEARLDDVEDEFEHMRDDEEAIDTEEIDVDGSGRRTDDSGDV